ncbi:MAG: transporter substrate-binding protein [Candidatus Binataceae bacterium]
MLGIAGTYAAWNYFQSAGRAENTRFVAAIRADYGPRRVTSDPIGKSRPVPALPGHSFAGRMEEVS